MEHQEEIRIDPVARKILKLGAAVLCIAGFALAIALTKENAWTSAPVVLHIGLGMCGGIAFWFARSQRYHYAATLLILAYWFGAASMTVINGGLRGPNLVNFPLVLIIASWLLGPVPTVLLAVLTELFIVGLFAAEEMGHQSLANYSNKTAFFIFLSAIILMTAWTSLTARRGYLRKVKEAQKTASVLAEREDELREHLDSLEQQVIARTLELSSAREFAEMASKAKGMFLANMSHEIRAPLYAITGMAYVVRNELKRKGLLPPEQSVQLDKLDTATSHLLEMINTVLDLSKIEAGKLEISNDTLNLEDLVEQVFQMVHDRATSKGLLLLRSVEQLPCALCGDMTRLRQVLLNYVGNAIKFTESGSVRVEISPLSEDATSVLMRFAVIDTGPGLSDAACEKLFNTFVQSDHASSRQFGGSGLGLSIARKLSELMGGEAGVLSTVGQGSDFWFTARLQKGAGLSAQPAVELGALPPLDTLRRRFSGTRVLLADDDEFSAEVSQYLLEDAGFQVDRVEDGAQAVARADEVTYALIIMDMHMPHMDGIEATRRIRRGASGRAVPVLAMTGNAFQSDMDMCLAAGMNGFVSKPTTPDILYTALLKLLS